MTALSSNLNLRSKGSGDLKEYPVMDNVHIYKGAIVAMDITGYARPARNTVAETILGIADTEFDNTITGHASGGRSAQGYAGVSVLTGRHFLLVTTGATQALINRPVYATDDQTVSFTLGAGNPVGIVTEFVSSTSVWVFIPLGVGGYGSPPIYMSAVAPTFTAPKGSICIAQNGSSASTRMFINTDGATTWTSFTTAA